MSENQFTPYEKELLLTIAKESIEFGLQHHRPQAIALETLPKALTSDAASFVTLHQNNNLRGCIGSLQAHRPLAQDIASNAYNAAFQDPRFPPIDQLDLPEIHIHLSVLSATSMMSFNDEADLLSQIRPGIDGLVLQSGFNRGTFLPSVWEQLPDKAEFLNHLKQKAGLPTDYWSNDLRVDRYTVTDIE